MNAKHVHGNHSEYCNLKFHKLYHLYPNKGLDRQNYV